MPPLYALRLTALPALVFLLALPVYLALPRAGPGFFVVSGVIALAAVEHPATALGLICAIILGYPLTEYVARRGGRAAFVAGVAVLHVAYFGCFFLPIPGPLPQRELREADRAAMFVLFSGVGVTFFRLLSFYRDRASGSLDPPGLRRYLAYMFYFPQFRHGPIERAGPFVRKLQEARSGWTQADARAGAARILLGFGSLACAAGTVRLGGAVLGKVGREVGDLLVHPEPLSLGEVLVLIHLPYAFLVFLEGGYASIQLGVGRVFGVRGAENYNWVILARNPREVWQRWNMTLGRWLRDYVYVPLARNRRHMELKTVAVFVYCGLLHGPQLRCLAWGLWTGGTIVLWGRLADATRNIRKFDRRGGSAAWVLTNVVYRLATVHWAAITVLILLDPDYCGVRVLRRYVELLGQAVAGLLAGR